MSDFGQVLRDHGLELKRARARALQINVGKLCNQTCMHCHVGAGPGRTEVMTREVADRIIAWMESHPVDLVDITGGAPELCPEFRRLAVAARGTGARVLVRCNLTVFHEPGQEDLPAFYREHRLEVVASLPCYLADNVDRQRGDGVFQKSIEALQRLNALGYGRNEDGLVLDLVYNPVGPVIAPAESALEPVYRRELKERHGIVFTRLICITNLPVTRFRSFLEKTAQLEDYQRLLVDHFNPATVDGLMCRDTINVGFQGDLFDCDFNQMVDLPLGGRRRFLWETGPAALEGERVATAGHCFGCTAGNGASCGGTLA